MEAGDHYIPVFLHFEEYSVGEAPHSRAATAAVDGRKLQLMFRYRFDRGLNCEGEMHPKRWTNVVIPSPRF